jgi:hypothetical protein
MALPNLTPEQRKEALEKAAKTRADRAKLRAQIKDGSVSISKVLNTKDDPVIDKLKVKDFISSLPGYGKAKTMKILEELEISDTRRIKGLGDRQREALLAKLS